MNTSIHKTLSDKFSSSKIFWVLVSIAVVSIVFKDTIFFRLLFGPMQIFETFLHEASHALACVFTGGWVSGLTIVEDGQGHGGLTFCHGGIPFIYSQAGYIGETLWGCLLIALARFGRISRIILMTFGVGMAIATLFFMPGTMFVEHRWLEGLGSIIWGLILSAAFFMVGYRLPEKFAHVLLLFIAVQACLSSLEGVYALLLQSMGLFPNTWSDATNMQRLTGIPALVWGLSWALFSIGMLGWVMWMTFQAEHKKTAKS